MRPLARRRRWGCLNVSDARSPITWERAAAIFGNPKPPKTVWEKQFDYNDDDLQRIARTPYEQFDFKDLWYYYHDLAYSKLQPDLFAYLFPVCLMHWHVTLQRNRGCGQGDADFHYGLRQGDILRQMLTPEQRLAVYQFFRDSFLERLDIERGFVRNHSKTPAYGWFHRFSDLGETIPRLDMIWNSWWTMKTPGQAVAVLQYVSGLMYEASENPAFDVWTKEKGGGPPPRSSYCSSKWLDENVRFLRATLTTDYVLERVTVAVDRLRAEHESALARQFESDLKPRLHRVHRRIADVFTWKEEDGPLVDWSI